MNFVNPPEHSPEGMMHQTFFSELIGRDVGYNIYLHTDYEKTDRPYPVAYHLHGYKGHESSEIRAMAPVCKARQAITVFPTATSGDYGWFGDKAPIEAMVVTELIPLIDKRYRTVATREGRSLSGFSMGGAGAFYYAIHNRRLFSSVTAYAGTYHHFFYSEYRGVGEPIEKARPLYEEMRENDGCFDRAGLLNLRQNAEDIRDSLSIKLQIGTEDPLICDNEIMHLYLVSLRIPHEYVKVPGAAHELDKTVFLPT